MKYFLHIDTSGDIGCIAISSDGVLGCKTINTSSRNHAGTINTMVQEMLSEARITLSDLSAIVVCAGPGSYTGLRIGMATAKGLCYALDIPLLLDNKLTLLAYQAYKKYKIKYKYYYPVLLARDKEYFVSVFDQNFINNIPAAHISEGQMEQILQERTEICIISQCISPEILEKYKESIHVDPNVEIDINSWAFYTFEQYKCNNIVNLSTAEPFYLKQVYTHK